METPTVTLNSISRLIPDGYYTRGQAAKMVGKSKDTLTRWHKDGTFIAKYTAQFGQLEVWLYSKADIDTLRVIASKKRPGRPRKTA